MSDKKENIYTNKVYTPVYKKTGVKPQIQKLYDTSKRDELLQELEQDKNDIPLELYNFLKHAAERHVIFNHSLIAEYFSHCDYKIKHLFEDSALVIIDYDKAVRNNLVTFETERPMSRIEYIENQIKSNTDLDIIEKYTEELNYLLELEHQDLLDF